MILATCGHWATSKTVYQRSLSVTVIQLLRYFPSFMKEGDFQSCPQEPIICPVFSRNNPVYPSISCVVTFIFML